ncbi:hypothetical protein EZ456_16180 [Pedobacter psychrodurus]|uniref:Uncharacterized protein n=1 Tax=Pedobacter psychrodurus TaxID=2530456 RepID=A0A4R0PTK8_9SPHI|nr:hypothetical protein [Pedobacter psychrodurus]TCD25074.1 hypothetical protein EZ456_16180 [Pedobacter psychrodurus]
MKNIFSKILIITGISLLVLLSFSNQANAQRFRGKIEYYSSVFPSEDGKIKSINGTKIEYYNSVFKSEDGKIKSIGNIKFEYNNSGSQKSDVKIKSILNENDDSESEDALDTYYFIERLNCQ